MTGDDLVTGSTKVDQEYQNRVRDLTQESYALVGQACIDVLEEAARIADLHHDKLLGMSVRYQLVERAQWSGLHQSAFVAFTWMLSRLGDDPDLENRWGGNVMWLFKWVAGSAAESPALTKEQIALLLDDMERHYESRGLSARAVEQVRSYVASDMGEFELAREFLLKARSLPDDDGTDCRACQTNAYVQMLAETNELDHAMREADPLFRGRLSCDLVPADTVGALVMPLFHAGRLEDADQLLRKVQRRLTKDGELMDSAGQSITFLVVTDQIRRATNLANKKMKFAFEGVTSYRQLILFLGCRLLCLRLLERSRSSIKLSPFRGIPWLPDANGKYDVEEMSHWFYETAHALARQFDERNGNRHFMTLLNQSDSLVKHVRPFPKK